MALVNWDKRYKGCNSIDACIIVCLPSALHVHSLYCMDGVHVDRVVAVTDFKWGNGHVKTIIMSLD